MAEDDVTGTEEQVAAPQGQDAQQQFVMQRVYLKDLSFESPDSPAVFQKEWKPAMSVDLRTKSGSIDDDNYEVVLTLTITAKLDEETAFLIEVQQAGIFFIRGLEGEELRRVLSIVCPNMLFPYARATIDSIAVKGTFPAVLLAQVNFEALYQQAVQQSQQQSGGMAVEPVDGPAEEAAS
jgi:preprotein translocase subunit SecB